MSASAIGVSKLQSRRQNISHLLECGNNPTEIARILNCSRGSVYSVMRMERVNGEPKPKRRNRKRVARTEELVEQIREHIESNSAKSVRAMAKQTGFSSSTISKVIRDDLGLSIVRRKSKRPRQLMRHRQMTAEIRQKRKTCAMFLLNRLQEVKTRSFCSPDLPF